MSSSSEDSLSEVEEKVTQVENFENLKKKPAAENSNAFGDDDEKERGKIREELSSMSFEELMKLKDELGSKDYNEAVFGTASNSRKRPKSTADYKRLNKNRPREMSTKHPVPFLQIEESSSRKIVAQHHSRDPRFDEKCGEYNSNAFKANYEFVNDIRKNEIKDLKNQLKGKTDENDRKTIKLLIQRLENQIREEKRRKLRVEIEKEEQNEIRKARNEGRQPHYKSMKELKATELVKQYEELKQSGKLGKHLEKRRKKVTAKDRKKFSFD